MMSNSFTFNDTSKFFFFNKCELNFTILYVVLFLLFSGGFTILLLVGEVAHFGGFFSLLLYFTLRLKGDIMTYYTFSFL